jgi:uncharacterized protein (DUF433 family)
MPRYPLNLPVELKRAAEEAAREQGVSLNQLVLWSLAEKVSELRVAREGRLPAVPDRRFPSISFRLGASGRLRPVVTGTGVFVKTLGTAHEAWGMSREEIQREYPGLTLQQVTEAIAYFEAHRSEIEADQMADEALVG